MNKIKSFLFEIVLIFALIVVLFVLIDPFKVFFSNTVLTFFTIIITLWFIVYASFVWMENSDDEREDLHIKYAGKISFITGTGILLVFILIQSFQHNLDIYLPITLGIMVISKIITLIYLNIKN